MFTLYIYMNSMLYDVVITKSYQEAYIKAKTYTVELPHSSYSIIKD